MADSTTTRRTDRLVLRPVPPTDIDRILEYRNLPEVNRWLVRTTVEPDEFRARDARADRGDDRLRLRPGLRR